MEKVKAFCKRKNIEISVKRYLIDALGAMAQGLFASLLIGTIISTLGTQLNIPILVTVELTRKRQSDRQWRSQSDMHCRQHL